MTKQHYIFLKKEFTLREMQVISLNALGLKQRQIAAYLNIAESTVKTHLCTIRIKLGYKKNEDDSRKLMSDSLANGFDREGNYTGLHLFPDHPASDMPWGAGI
ncbi:MAG: helix-turn-helix transcriptional regulator [Flavobacteriales bacterium]|nr:helix-turn-helix transcriptional regulator [Flavobacteriales bacterium]